MQYIEAGKNGMFQKADGSLFVPIGHCEGAGYFIERTSKELDEFFGKMARSGENTLRTIIDTPKIIEGEEIGSYDDFFFYFQPIYEAAMNNEIYLIVSIYFPTFVTWNKHPYGIYSINYNDFFEDENMLRLQEERIKALLDKYREPVILSWELCNEVQREQNAWVERMAQIAVDHTDSMLSVSIGDCTVGDSSWCQWNGNFLDYISFHSYSFNEELTLWIKEIRENNDTAILDKRRANAGRIARLVREKSGKDIPIIDTEVPRLPQGWPQRLLVNWRLTKTDQDLIDASFIDTGAEYMKNGLSGPGLPWTITEKMQGLLSQSVGKIKGC